MVVALLSLASCVKDDLYDMPGPGPDPGNDAKLVVKPDYSAMSMDAVIPPACRLAIDDYDVYDETDKAQFEIPVTYGSHDLLAYSLPEGISVSGEIAWVNARGARLSRSPATSSPAPCRWMSSRMASRRSPCRCASWCA